jgi:hypothetical protein
MIYYLLYIMFLNGHKNGHVGSGSESIINLPPGSVEIYKGPEHSLK